MFRQEVEVLSWNSGFDMFEMRQYPLWHVKRKAMLFILVFRNKSLHVLIFRHLTVDIRL